MAAVATTWILGPIALILLCLTVGVMSGTGIVTNFSINSNTSAYVIVDSGKSIQITCRVTYNLTTSSSQPPIVYIKKVDPTNRTWAISSNDDSDVDMPPTWTVVATDPALLPLKTEEYIVTIPNAQNGDSGNYTCSAGNTGVRSRIQVDVTSEATSAVITFNGQQLPPMQYNSVQVTLGTTYSVSCTISGGNPYPKVNLSSSKGDLPGAQTSYSWNATYMNSITGYVNRSTTLTVNSWTFTDSSLLGKPVTCSGGVKNPMAVSTSFTPSSDSVVPQFTCDDKVNYPANVMDLMITCELFAPNLTAGLVQWVNSTKYNHTLTAAAGQTINYPTDTRYVLAIISKPPAGSQTYLMTLTIKHAHDISDLNKNSYKFVATNSRGQAAHPITVVSATGNVGGASQNAMSAVSLLTTLLVAAAALMM